MKRIILFIILSITIIRFSYACSPFPGVVDAEFIEPTKRAVLIEEYKNKIQSPSNIFESPKPSWTNRGVPSYQIIRESGLYTELITDNGLCLKRGLYVRKWLAVPIYSLISFFFLLYVYLLYSYFYKKKSMSKLKVFSIFLLMTLIFFDIYFFVLKNKFFLLYDLLK